MSDAAVGRPVIRRSAPGETDRIVGIWLEASRLAHAFIPYEFWLCRADEMAKVYLPGSQTYVLDTGFEVAGFLSLVDDQVAALFVAPCHQRLGYGRRLLRFAQDRFAHLSLCVYQQNEHAIAFYRAAGFCISEQRLDLNTREVELLMNWPR